MSLAQGTRRLSPVGFALDLERVGRCLLTLTVPVPDDRKRRWGKKSACFGLSRGRHRQSVKKEKRDQRLVERDEGQGIAP